MAKWQTVIEKLWVIGAMITDTVDEIVDESAEMLKLGGERLVDLAALLVHSVFLLSKWHDAT